MNYYWYLIFACLCFVGEMFTMELSLTCLGVGLLGAALASGLGASLWWQVILFCIVSLICWLGVRPIALKHLYKKGSNVKTPAEDVIGKTAVVEIDIDPLHGTGRVRVSGESWKATAAKALAKGTQCIVEKLEGVTLFVKEK